ncbi:hypothetical protein AYO20_08759 [Fonsecaea nubica]|uniref:Uncharacterized protein n=1 Tax=Fonsecaea nubica TaxID=856822 RepID=A0A178CN78_9EURO|nr:hypothetical protein AYO20_08759 [Fonsecaea nubica]OAL30281.1 hypothetical protein AYO20_08759 [Fonsecaea nubica]
MDNEDLINAELEELEIEQRQLDLDRKKLELRLRLARLYGRVETPVDGSQAKVKAEPVEDANGVEGLAGESTNVPATSDRIVKREAMNPPHLVEQGQATDQSSQLMTTPNRSPNAPHPSSQLTDFSKLPCSKPPVSSYATPVTDRSISRGSPQSTPARHSQGYRFGLPTSSPRKRVRSPGSEDDDFVPAKKSSALTKQVKELTKNKITKGKGNKQSPKVDCLPEHHASALIRRYGERLVQRHMQSFRRHERQEAKEVIKAGSEIVDGLLEKKFETLEELHDEYDRQIRLYCAKQLQEPLIMELQKFCRAAPVWWRKCTKKRTQQERLEDVAMVFKDVGEGTFD